MKLFHFITKPFITVRSCWPHAQPTSWRTTPCRMSATALHIWRPSPSSATRGHAVPS
jgi:hypothetical protein